MKTYKKVLVFILLVTTLSIIFVVSASASALVYGVGTVSASTLNVREQAQTTAPISAALSKGNTVVILEKTNDSWYHISYDGIDGYTAARYLSDLRTVENFTAVGTLLGDVTRLRSEPSVDGILLDSYQAGTIVNVLGINDGWYKVEFNSTVGYIRSDFLSLTKGGVVSSPTPQITDLRQSIVDFAKQFVGYSYVYGAASPKVGFDCSGLTSYVYKAFGYLISRTASLQYKNNGVSVSKADLAPGDLVFFSSNGGKSVTHVGLYIGSDLFVNASTSSTGVIISSLSSAYYKRVWYGAKHIVD